MRDNGKGAEFILCKSIPKFIKRGWHLKLHIIEHILHTTLAYFIHLHKAKIGVSNVFHSFNMFQCYQLHHSEWNKLPFCKRGHFTWLWLFQLKMASFGNTDHAPKMICTMYHIQLCYYLSDTYYILYKHFFYY